MNAMHPRVTIDSPYLLLVGDETRDSYAKTGFGLVHWARERCLGQFRSVPDAVDLGLDNLDIGAAAAAGARTLVVGVTPDGGRIPEAWLPVLTSALEAGLDIAAGMHDRLNDNAELRSLATRLGRRLIDVRTSPSTLRVGTGARRDGRRALMVGTDCAVGKKYMALALAHELTARGTDTSFRATGQTGIMIAGEGIPIDAVVSDFVSGAAEALTPEADPEHWDIIEGQGSLFHPSYAAVTLGLIHGSQPEALVLCHDPSRECIDGLERYPVPTLEKAMRAYLDAARLTSPLVRIVGIGLNTSRFDEQEALEIIDRTEQRIGLVCADPMRTGVSRIADELLKESQWENSE